VSVTSHGVWARMRARLAVREHRHVVYKLGEGGRDPWATNCSTPWESRLRHGGTFSLVSVPASDCVGFALWCLGVDRYQPETFPLWGGWMNTDSMIADARGGRTWWEEIPRWKAQVGDLVVYGAKYLGLSKGHVGVVVGVTPYAGQQAKVWTDRLTVAHCSSGHQKLLGYSISMEAGSRIWTKRATVLRLREERIPQ
jgi:hypothetical protein